MLPTVMGVLGVSQILVESKHNILKTSVLEDSFCTVIFCMLGNDRNSFHDILKASWKILTHFNESFRLEIFGGQEAGSC